MKRRPSVITLDRQVLGKKLPFFEIARADLKLGKIRKLPFNRRKTVTMAKESGSRKGERSSGNELLMVK